MANDDVPLCSNREPLGSRRDFLTRTALGMGGLALSTILSEAFAPARAEASTGNMLAPKTPPIPVKAKHVIHIFASGAPSHLDTFDPKPGMKANRGQTVSGASGVLFPSPFEFKKCGKSGLEISELFPRLQGVADDLCVIRSMKTDVPAHPAAQKLMNTGNLTLVRPSVGSWVLYGLGTENQNLPGFVTLGGEPDWRQSSFLPSPYQGSRANFTQNSRPDQALLNLRNEFTGQGGQRLQLDLARKLNGMHAERVEKDEQLDARIDSFELAFRMQTAATDAFDINKETPSTREKYGRSEFGAKLLCARRLVERGVRFVQVEIGGWDHHQGLVNAIGRKANEMDQPVAALIADLKERGLLESTLVIWGGEFGRTPTTSGNINDQSGRDHHSRCFSTFLAGGGVKAGTVYGATDEIGMSVAENPVHVHDLHATVLRLLGFDHKKLTYRYNGRDFRLTDNYGNIVDGIIS